MMIVAVRNVWELWMLRNRYILDFVHQSILKM